MPAEDNKAIMRRFNEEYIAKLDPKAFDEIIAPDFHNHSTPEGVPSGPDGVRAYFEMLHAAFPDLTVEIYDLIAEGDKVMTRKAFHGTHQGPLMGIPPTGKRVVINVIDVVVIRDGRLSEHWNVVDQLGMLQQLGVGPQLG